MKLSGYSRSIPLLDLGYRSLLGKLKTLIFDLHCFAASFVAIAPEDKKVQVGKDQEKAQSEKRFPLQKLYKPNILIKCYSWSQP